MNTKVISPVVYGSGAKKEYQNNILLVDDRPENLLTLQSVLDNGERNFFKAESGNEALKIALKESLSLIMMDIQMPEMDGIETAKLLRLNQRTSHVPIIFVSAINPKEKYPLDGFKPGTVDFLFKPLNLVDTKTKVAIFENLWSQQQELLHLKSTYGALTKEFDRFVYMVSHDLNAPLRALNNLATWIGDDLGETADQNIKENLLLLKQRVTRINQMIDGILDYSRAGHINEKPELVNPAHLLHAVFESVQSSENFSLELNGQWQEMFTMKTSLEKVFRQLIKNAIMHHNREKGLIKASCHVEKEGAIFTISDDGPGIKSIHQHIIFEMFQTLNPKHEDNNVGSGLAIVKKIIENHGGQIHMEPVEPNGCKFVFTWPL